jgi:alpha-N-acetylglucosamine transferase
VIDVPTITNEDLTCLQIMGREDLASTFTKLTLWEQTQFSRIVYLDADTLPFRAPDELFSIDTPFAAAPELGFPDCFNSGVMVLEPSHTTYEELRQLGLKGESFDGGDQGLLNVKFRQWEKLSFMYNMELYPTYRLYMPAVNKWKDEIKIIHFIGKRKPWAVDPNEKPIDDTAYSKFYQEALRKWWGIYDDLQRKAC